MPTSKKILIAVSTIVIAAIVVLFFILSNKTPINEKSISENTDTQTVTEAAKPEEQIKSNIVNYTALEVSSHKTKDDCWTIIDSFVYDITDFIAEHPGGEIIATICGTDGTQKFKNQGVAQETADSFREENGLPPGSIFHSPVAQNKLESYKLGPLNDEKD